MMIPDDQLKIDMLQEKLFHLRDIWVVGNYQEVKAEIESVQKQIHEIRNNSNQKEV